MFSFPSLVCSLSLLRQTQFWDCWATLYLGLCQCPLRKSHVGDDLFLAEPWKLPGKKISLLSSSTSSLFQSCTCQEKRFPQCPTWSSYSATRALCPLTVSPATTKKSLIPSSLQLNFKQLYWISSLLGLSPERSQDFCPFSGAQIHSWPRTGGPASFRVKPSTCTTTPGLHLSHRLKFLFHVDSWGGLLTSLIWTGDTARVGMNRGKFTSEVF